MKFQYFLCAALLACGRPAAKPEQQPHASAVALPRPVTETPLAAAVTATVEPDAAQEASIYDLPAALVGQDGKRIGLDVWRGQPTIIAMFFASCPQACPLLIGNIQFIESGLTPAERAQARVLLVSFEPDADTPAVLRGAARKYGLDLSRWRLARANAETVRDIAAVLGVAYRRLDDGSYSHSSVIALVDAQGHIVAQQDGIARAREPVGPALAKLADALTGHPAR